MANLTGDKLDEYVQNSDTCQFYKNKTLFVTGVTGFCGKVRVFFLLKYFNKFQLYFNIFQLCIYCNHFFSPLFRSGIL